jgi:hypothetical protein
LVGVYGRHIDKRKLSVLRFRAPLAITANLVTGA